MEEGVHLGRGTLSDDYSISVGLLKLRLKCLASYRKCFTCCFSESSWFLFMNELDGGFSLCYHCVTNVWSFNLFNQGIISTLYNSLFSCSSFVWFLFSQVLLFLRFKILGYFLFVCLFACFLLLLFYWEFLFQIVKLFDISILQHVSFS